MPDIQSDFELIVNGYPLNENAKNHVSDIMVNHAIDKTSILTFKIRGSENFKPSSFPFGLESSIVFILHHQRSSYRIFSGDITDIDIECPPDSGVALKITCHDRSWRLKRVGDYGIYPYPTLLQNIKEILADNGFTGDFYAEDIDKLPFRSDQSIVYGPEEKNKTAWGVIYEIGQIIGPRVFVEDDQLFMVSDELLKRIQPYNIYLIYNPKPEDIHVAENSMFASNKIRLPLLDINLGTSISDKRGEVNLEGWDFNKKATNNIRQEYKSLPNIFSDPVSPTTYRLQPDATVVDINNRNISKAKEKKQYLVSLDVPEWAEKIIDDKLSEYKVLKRVDKITAETGKGMKFGEPYLKSERYYKIDNGLPPMSDEAVAKILPALKLTDMDDQVAKTSELIRKKIERAQSENLKDLLIASGKIQGEPRLGIRQWHNIKLNMNGYFGLDIDKNFLFTEVEHRINTDGFLTTFKACYPYLIHKDFKGDVMIPGGYETK